MRSPTIENGTLVGSVFFLLFIALVTSTVFGQSHTALGEGYALGTPISPTLVSTTESDDSITSSSEAPLLKLTDADRPRLKTPTEKKASARGGVQTILITFMNLAIVLGAILLLAWFLKKWLPNQNRGLSTNMIECLGQYRLTPQHRLCLIRFLDRCFLVSISGDRLSVITELNVEEVSQIRSSSGGGNGTEDLLSKDIATKWSDRLTTFTKKGLLILAGFIAIGMFAEVDGGNVWGQTTPFPQVAPFSETTGTTYPLTPPILSDPLTGAAQSTPPTNSENLPTALTNQGAIPSITPTISPGPTTLDVDSIKNFLEQENLFTGPEGIQNSLKMLVTLAILSLVPAILLMTTSFVRIATVLAILRQAFGSGQLPPNQVTMALSIFLTFLVMMPVWNDLYQKSILPYSEHRITAEEARLRGEIPIRNFMITQLQATGNMDNVWMFMKYVPDAKTTPKFQDEIPWQALLPAFVVSELKTAFMIGFQIFLPFVVIDLVVAGLMVSMGMMMVPPTIVSLPFKLMLFVMMDGWTLVVKMLLDSFIWIGG